jgi:hypothetical protein
METAKPKIAYYICYSAQKPLQTSLIPEILQLMMHTQGTPSQFHDAPYFMAHHS